MPSEPYDHNIIKRTPATVGAAAGHGPRRGDSMSERKVTPAEGVSARHSKTCRSRSDGRCSCTPTYQAHVWSNRDRKRVRKTFVTLAAAKAWRRDALTALDRGRFQPPTATTVREAAATFLEGAGDGTIRNSAGDSFKPSAVRTYAQALNLRVLPVLGDRKLSDVSRFDVQDLADHLHVAGRSASTVHLAVASLRAICRRAVSRGVLAVNPCDGVSLPAARGSRDRIIDPTEGASLIAALPEADRALWATAFYAGLRRGELRGLRWSDVDLQAGVIRVERGWDDVVGAIEPKSRKSRRTVPIAAVLREYLIARKLSTGGTGLAFGDGVTAFRPDKAQERADRAWATAGLNRATFHVARHAFASMMIAAGANPKAITVYMGHASITTTFNIYGHLMPGNEAEAAGMLNDYLTRATMARQ
jgi:integrase